MTSAYALGQEKKKAIKLYGTPVLCSISRFFVVVGFFFLAASSFTLTLTQTDQLRKPHVLFFIANCYSMVVNFSFTRWFSELRAHLLSWNIRSFAARYLYTLQRAFTLQLRLM